MGSGDYGDLPRVDFYRVLKLDDGPGVKGRNYQQGRKTKIVGGEAHAGGDVQEDGDSECGRCKGYVNEGLQCDACQRWFHMQCEQVSQKEYKRISDMGTSKEQEVGKRMQGGNKCKHTRGRNVTRDNLGKNTL